MKILRVFMLYEFGLNDSDSDSDLSSKAKNHKIKNNKIILTIKYKYITMRYSGTMYSEWQQVRLTNKLCTAKQTTSTIHNEK